MTNGSSFSSLKKKVSLANQAKIIYDANSYSLEGEMVQKLRYFFVHFMTSHREFTIFQ